MLKIMKDGYYNRDVLIGLPRLVLKDFKCQNIVCGKHDQFKKFKENYICECGYIATGEFKIEQTIKPKLYCKTSPCIEGKTRMNIECLKCKFIGEK